MYLTRFDQHPTAIHPVDLYTATYPALQPNQEHWYASGPITSGGAVRWRKDRPTLETSEIIRANQEFIRTLFLYLAQEPALSGRSVTLPHTVGSRRHTNELQSSWRESDYLPFWIMVMHRLNPGLAGRYWQHIAETVDTDAMNDYHAPRTERVSEYYRIEEETLSFMDDHQRMTDPVTGILRLPDSSRSLGSTLEQRIAQQQGIPLHEVALNHAHPEFSALELSKDPVCQTLLSLGVISTPTTPNCIGALHCLTEELVYDLSA